MLDKKKYYLTNIAESTEYKISIKNDNITVEESSKPQVYFDSNKTGGLCVVDNACKYGTRAMTSSYNKEG